MSNPITIADFPVERSKQYAKEQETYNPKLIEGGHAVALKASIDTTVLGFTSYFDKLFDLRQVRKPYAQFDPPPGKRVLFLLGSIVSSSLGSSDRREAQKVRVVSIQPIVGSATSDTMSWELENRRDLQLKEKQSLLDVFDQLDALAKDWELGNGARSQYYKA